MDTIQISLPAALKDWLDQQVASKGFQNPSAMVEDLLRREQAADFRESIDRQLRESIASGEPTPMTAAEWERLRKLGRQQAAQRHT